MTDRPIRAILDASAIVRYVHGDDDAIHVGEVLTQVDESDAAAGLPVMCMAQALREVGDGLGHRFELLLDHSATELLVGPEDWRALAVVMDLVGRWDVAVAAWLAMDFEVAVFSAEPDLYAGIDDPYLVIEV